MNRFTIGFILLFNLAYVICFSQKAQKPKLFLSAGYGLAGSFFVRSYDEFAPVSRYKTFYKKNFVGTAQNMGLGVRTAKGWEFRMGINFQHFTKHVQAKDTLNNVYITLDHTIHHRDYMWYGVVNKTFDIRKYILSYGLGLYYLRPKQEEVEIYYPNFFANIERNQKNSRLNEAGVFTEFAYEFKFQPKANIGLKTQFYFTASGGYAESITLLPFIKLNF